MQITIEKIRIFKLKKSINVIPRAYKIVLGLLDTSLNKLFKQHISWSWVRSRNGFRTYSKTKSKTLDGKSFTTNRRYDGEIKVEEKAKTK